MPATCLRRLLLVATVFLLATPLLAQVDTSGVVIDTTYSPEGERIYQLTPLTITARQIRWSEKETPMDKDDLQRSLEQSGVGLIRRGVFMAGDLYLDGFKRGDIEVTIDGERYPNACPNRMDPPTTRVNPLEMESILLDKTSTGLQSGIGGKIRFRRSLPGSGWRVRGGLTGSGASSRSVDASLSIEHRQQRLSMQVIRGEPYEDGSGAGFTELYGYRDADLTFGRVETSFHGHKGLAEYGLFYSTTSDVPFPYLGMDERFDRMIGGFVRIGDHRLYINRTHHLMNNELRKNVAMMFMESDATNITAGLTGNRYEVFYRHWDIENRFEPRGAASWSPFDQHVMPDLHVLSFSTFHERSIAGIVFTGKVGLSRFEIADKDRLRFYQTLHPSAQAARWFIPFSATAGHARPLLNGINAAIIAEIGSEAPVAENLYIAVGKPMGKPGWSGNPTLSAPIKAGLRLILESDHISMEAFTTRVDRYVYLDRRMVDGLPFVTYDNVNVFLTGFNAALSWKYAGVRGSYTQAQNLTASLPLADVAPLQVEGALRSRSYWGLQAHLKALASAVQNRFDPELGEDRTPGWYRVDAGLSYDLRNASVLLEVTNVTDARYYHHLSFFRDPFAAGVHVYEPGRVVRLGLRFDY